MSRQLMAQTKIVIGAEAIRPIERAAAYLQKQVEQRSGWRWQIVKGVAAEPGDIVLGIPGDGTDVGVLPPEYGLLLPRYREEITLRSSNNADQPAVVALAGSKSVALVTAGKLARSLDLQSGWALVPSLHLRERPSFPVRGHNFANHKQNNTYDKWSYEHWEEYLTEMAAWGDNIEFTRPCNPARFDGCLPWTEEGPWFDMPEREEEFYRQLEIQKRMPALVHELGMRYGIDLAVNCLFKEEARRHPEVSRYAGTYVCPSIPEGRRRIRDFRDKLFSLMQGVDVFFMPSGDSGGCPGCPDCTPWAPVLIELFKEQAEQIRKYHPGCMIWISQQSLRASDTEILLEWLNRERPDWLEAVHFGPFSELMSFGDVTVPNSFLDLEEYERSGLTSGPIARLRAALPIEYKVVLYPDEVHTHFCQYPLIGADPAVQYIWGREDGPSPRPMEMAGFHAATCSVSDGSVPYSEGNTDDLNKFIWSGRSWDSSLTGEQIVAQYARWFFGPDCETEASELILKMEQILNAPIYGNRTVQEARALLDSCERRNPSLLDDWRWLNLRVGLLMLEHIQQVRHRDRRILASLRYRVAVWRSWQDPSPGLRQTIQYLETRFAETNGLLEEIVWTRDKLFAMQKLAIRGVGKLQNSYMRLDVLVEAWREVLARFERGELAEYRERYRAILDPLVAAGASNLLNVKGRSLVKHVQEFVWEEGSSEWPWQ